VEVEGDEVTIERGSRGDNGDDDDLVDEGRMVVLDGVGGDDDDVASTTAGVASSVEACLGGVVTVGMEYKLASR
jgi:hypothetical protein